MMKKRSVNDMELKTKILACIQCGIHKVPEMAEICEVSRITIRKYINDKDIKGLIDKISIANKHKKIENSKKQFIESTKAGILANKNEHITLPKTAKKLSIHKNQEGKCFVCRDKDIEIYHHIIPTRIGGNNKMNNLIGLCHSCHGGIHSFYNYKLFKTAKESETVFADWIKEYKEGLKEYNK